MDNKQQTAVEWFSVRRDVLEIEVRLGKLSPIEYAEELTKAEQQAKEMHKEEMLMFVLNVMGKYRNGDVLAEVAEQYYKETYGGGEL
jgi:hypothetical protein